MWVIETLSVSLYYQLLPLSAHHHFYMSLTGGNGIEEGGDILLQTSVMPRKHEAVVRKRMNTLRSTIKRQRDGEKKSTGSRSDVRNIFNSSKVRGFFHCFVSLSFLECNFFQMVINKYLHLITSEMIIVQ